MKRVAVLLLTLLLGLALAPSAQAAGKTLRWALDADPVSLDPHVQLSGGMLQYSHLVFDPLVRWTKDMKLEGRLAEKMERINPTTVRFTLRKGVTFHSGNPFTAADVKWTLDRLKTSQDFKGLYEVFESPTVVSDLVVDIKTREPYSLIEAMATYIFPMDSKFYSGTDDKGQPKDAIVKVGPSFALNNESGTGPYKVTARDQGVKWEFARFADYWDKASKGNVDKIVLTPIKEEATRVAALLSGDVDFISPVPPQDYDRLGKEKNVQLVTMAGSRVITLQLNQERRAEFKDKRVRQAIVLATDNVGIAKKIMNGKATPAAQQSPKGFAAYVEDLQPKPDLEKAKKLMKEAGFDKGFTVTMIAPNNRYVNDEKIAQAFVSMMAKINIKVELKTMPKAQYWDEFDARVADIQMIGWHPDTEDSANYFEYLLMCPSKETGYGQYNSGLYCNPKMDELVVASQREGDQAKRSKLLQQAERIAAEDAAYVPLHWQHLSWAVGKKVKNITDVVNVMDFPYVGDMVME
ncbi:MAG: ABC transporter substrate-binding protein [Thermodesulfobacteriota bacterium]